MKLQCIYCGVNFDWKDEQLDKSIVDNINDALKYDYIILCPNGCSVRLNEAMSSEDLAKY